MKGKRKEKEKAAGSVECTITLLNRTYEMRCPENEVETLKESAALLNEKLTQQRQQFSHLTEFQLMLLAAVSSGHELLKCQKQQALEREQVSHFVGLLEKNKSHPLPADSAEVLA